MESNRDPLPDPVAYARDLTEEQLKDYKQIYGEQSREWVIAQQELARRRYPPWARIVWNLIALVVAIAVAIKLFG